MIFFAGWNVSWSPASSFLQHAYINWMTRGLHSGYRRVHLGTQVDDVHLSTELYEPTGGTYRLTQTDLANHVTWMDDINSRLPAGSSYIIELAHNGNGNIEHAKETLSSSQCSGASLIDLKSAPAGSTSSDLEYVKPPGTGTSLWPGTPRAFSATTKCMEVDPLLRWLRIPANRDMFAHVSHTYTHMELNSATYADAVKEITFNQAWLKAANISSGYLFSSLGLVPPSITGLHNSDVVKAWVENGIQFVVGDNTRPALRNSNPYWPIETVRATGGTATVAIIPRWATFVFYNCATSKCDQAEFTSTKPESVLGGLATDLWKESKIIATRHLLALHHDPFMFHQANLRTGAETIDVNGKKATSLLMAWTEGVLQEMIRLTNWPIITKTHDELGWAFVDRRTRDQCGYKLDLIYGSGGTSIVGVRLSASNNQCSVPIPVTFPGPVVDSRDSVVEQVCLLAINRV